jgi:outer membrane protein OmpA-like peptidoglycan-associated protein
VAAIALDRIAAYLAFAGLLGVGGYLISEQPASNSAVAGVATRLAELDARISALPPVDPALRIELDELKSSVETWALRSAAAESKLDDLEMHFAALAPADPDLRSDLGALQAALENRIARLEENVSVASPGTQALDRKVAELEAAIVHDRTLLADLHVLRSSLDVLTAGRAADRTQFEERLANLDRRLSDLPVPDASLRSDVDALKAAVQAVSNGNAAVRDDLDKRFAELDGRIAGLIEAGARSPLGQTTVEPKLAELDAGVSAQAASDPTLRADLDVLKSTFDGWRSESATTRETLNEKLAELGELIAALPTPDPGLRADFERLEALVETQSMQAAARAAELEERLASLDTARAESGNLQASAQLSAELSRLEGRIAAFEHVQRQPKAPSRVLETFYFRNASSELGDEEAEKLRGLADKMAGGSIRVAIIGFTDTVGPADYNRSLSQRRAAKVRTLLLGLGVEPASIISVDGVGEDGTPIRTSDGEALATNRAVVIYAYE